LTPSMALPNQYFLSPQLVQWKNEWVAGSVEKWRERISIISAWAWLSWMNSSLPIWQAYSTYRVKLIYFLGRVFLFMLSINAIFR
jgi:hypothetical protein